MKTKYFSILLLLICVLMFAQTPNLSSTNNINKGFQISVRGGYDALPNYKNNTPYINYKGNWMAGASLDYYFNKNWGLGLDYDFLVNNPKSVYPTQNLMYGGFNVSTLNLTENHVERSFIGIGPNYRWKKNDRWNLEFKVKGGISTINGGYTLLEGIVPASPPLNIALNHHAGYNAKNVFSAKASAQFNYFFNQWLGMHLGVYHINHFKVSELVDPARGFSSSYYDFSTQSNETTINQKANIRDKACDCNINSTGVYAGITIRFPKGEPKCNTCQLCSVCHKVHEPPMCPPPSCSTCQCKVSVIAKDKISGELLADTDVILQREDGIITATGKTNSFGTVVFDNVAAANYTVKGKLYNVNLEETKINKTELDNCKASGGVIQKEILYTDDNFVIKGIVTECNTTKPVEGVNVEMSNKALSSKKNTISGTQGEYIFQAKQNSTYTLLGHKDGYFSNEVQVNTASYDRTKSLFIKFEICIDPCGKAIKLKNINFNLDKSDILPASEPDLQYVVNLMKKNPKIKVELSSHTDSRASQTYNQNLSQRRAQSSVNYIVNQGIERSRLVARGAGETELLNRCSDNVKCTEEEHRINRRTEFKILCVENY